MPLSVHGTTYDSFDSAVKGVMERGNYDEETAKKIVGKAYHEQEGKESDITKNEKRKKDLIEQWTDDNGNDIPDKYGNEVWSSHIEKTYDGKYKLIVNDREEGIYDTKAQASQIMAKLSAEDDKKDRQKYFGGGEVNSDQSPRGKDDSKTEQTPMGSEGEIQNTTNDEFPEHMSGELNIKKGKLPEDDKIEFEGETYVLSPKGYIAQENDIEFEGRLYVKEYGIRCDLCGKTFSQHEDWKVHKHMVNHFRPNDIDWSKVILTPEAKEDYDSRPFGIKEIKTGKIILRYNNRVDAEKYIEGLKDGYKNDFEIVTEAKGDGYNPNRASDGKFTSDGGKQSSTSKKASIDKKKEKNYASHWNENPREDKKIIDSMKNKYGVDISNPQEEIPFDDLNLMPWVGNKKEEKIPDYLKTQSRDSWKGDLNAYGLNRHKIAELAGLDKESGYKNFSSLTPEERIKVYDWYNKFDFNEYEKKHIESVRNDFKKGMESKDYSKMSKNDLISHYKNIVERARNNVFGTPDYFIMDELRNEIIKIGDAFKSKESFALELTNHQDKEHQSKKDWEKDLEDMKKEIEYKGETYYLALPQHDTLDNDLVFENRIYTKVPQVLEFEGEAYILTDKKKGNENDLELDGRIYSKEAMVCPACDGEGKRNDEKCKLCGGKGVKQDPLSEVDTSEIPNVKGDVDDIIRDEHEMMKSGEPEEKIHKKLVDKYSKESRDDYYVTFEDGFQVLRQKRFRDQLNAGKEHPDDIMAYARNNEEMERMIKMITGESFQIDCKWCTYSTTNPKNMSKHFKENHPEKNQFGDSVIREKYAKESERKNGNFPCLVCGDSFDDELSLERHKHVNHVAKEGGSVPTVSGLPSDSTIPMRSKKVLVEPKKYRQTESVLIKTKGGYIGVPVYEALNENQCQFCGGMGEVIVEDLGLNECPRCHGDGNEPQTQDMPQVQETPQIQNAEKPSITNSTIPQPPIDQKDSMNKTIPFSGDGKTGGQEPTNKPIEKNQNPFEKKKEGESEKRWIKGTRDNKWYEIDENDRDWKFGVPKEEKEKIGESVCPNMIKYKDFVRGQISILEKKAKAGESVGLLLSKEIAVENGGTRIHGVLAYAGQSLNGRIYVGEELAKGHGMTVPLLLNHSSTAGAEAELYRLNDTMRRHLETGKDYKVGEVTLTWNPEKLTLFYEGVVTDPFFQKEITEANMAVSLGIYYDSNSPKYCPSDRCYTLIKGAEFREVSLVYHPGFPIATIEAVESEIRRAMAAESAKITSHLTSFEGYTSTSSGENFVFNTATSTHSNMM